MQAHERSRHSVSKVVRDGRRCCVSNCYFSPRLAVRKIGGNRLFKNPHVFKK